MLWADPKFRKYFILIIAIIIRHLLSNNANIFLISFIFFLLHFLLASLNSICSRVYFVNQCSHVDFPKVLLAPEKRNIRQLLNIVLYISIISNEIQIHKIDYHTCLSSVKSGRLFMSPAQHFEIILYNSGWQWLGLSSLYPSRTLRITSRAPIPGYGVEPKKR